MPSLHRFLGPALLIALLAVADGNCLNTVLCIGPHIEPSGLKVGPNIEPNGLHIDLHIEPDSL